ncbi:hypothetical protein [Cellulosimicrobium sp. NPDC057127]|uniref:hypothetical protein n=1 Tax=Cellulosimicrobium sp. NPDC057127 TaxID=3346026 RepID=UPI003643DAF1
MTTTASSTGGGVPQLVARVVRAVVLATTSLTVAAAAHASAGGGLPDGAGLAALGALTVALATLVARMRSRALVQVPFLAVVQVVLHHGFTMLATDGPLRGAGTLPASMPGHASAPGFVADRAAHAAHAAASWSGGYLPGAPEHVAHGTGPAMLGAHAVAVVVTAAALAASERAATFALALWTGLLPVVLGVLLPVPTSPRPVVLHPVRSARPLARAASTVVSRRGPPATTSPSYA